MTAIDHFLYFYTPCLSLRDIRLALRFATEYGSREGFFTILKTHRRNFDDYSSVEKALRDYGFKKEDQKATEKETPQAQVRKAFFRESLLKGLGFDERKKVAYVEKVFKGRLIKKD